MQLCQRDDHRTTTFESIIDEVERTYARVFRFRRGREEAIVEAEDHGYAVQVWTRVIVRGEYQTHELARFYDAETLAQHVAAIRERYLEEGWTVDDPIETITKLPWPTILRRPNVRLCSASTPTSCLATSSDNPVDVPKRVGSAWC